jgi:hypothetical protein
MVPEILLIPARILTLLRTDLVGRKITVKCKVVMLRPDLDILVINHDVGTICTRRQMSERLSVAHFDGIRPFG